MARPALSKPSSRGDRLCGSRMVAGNHHHTDTGVLARPDRGHGLGPRRVDHPYQAEERHVSFRVAQRCASFGRHGQHPHALACHLMDCLQNRRPASDVEGGFPPGRLVPPTGIQDDLRSALGIRRDALGHGVQRCHALGLGGERDFAHSGILRVEIGLHQARLGRHHHQRTLRRIAFDLPAAIGIVADDVGVGSEGCQPATVVRVRRMTRRSRPS